MTRLHALFIVIICALGAGGNYVWSHIQPAQYTDLIIAKQPFKLEVASTHSQRMRGLMHRDDLTPCGGMVFFFPKPSLLSFWMHNTPTPLWMAFVAPDNSILNIIPTTTPFNDAPLYAAGMADKVIEINAACGQLADIRVGDKVQFNQPDAVVIK